MNRTHQRMNLKNSEELAQGEPQKSMGTSCNEYDGESSESGYDQAIFDLLKSPVTLGMRGMGSNRGHQR